MNYESPGKIFSKAAFLTTNRGTVKESLFTVEAFFHEPSKLCSLGVTANDHENSSFGWSRNAP